MKNYILKILRIFEKTNDLKKGYVKKDSKIENLTKRSQEETKKNRKKTYNKCLDNKQTKNYQKTKKSRTKVKTLPKTNNRLKKKKKKKEQQKKKNKTIYC